MDKKSGLDRIQNIAILLLALSAVFLLTQTPLAGELAGKTPYELAQDIFSDDSAAGEDVSVDLTELALPVSVAAAGEYACFGQEALTTRDADFERAGVFFSEALGSAETIGACGEERFSAALRTGGLYLSLGAETPLELLAGILGVSAPEKELLRVDRLLLCPTEDGGTVLYLHDEEKGFFSCRTAVSGTALAESIAAFEGSGADFAFSLSGDYAKLSPYSLLFSETAERYTLSAVNGPADEVEFLRLAEFNPHTESAYTDSSGSTVIPEVYGTLRLQPDGSVFYQSGSAAAGSLYFISAADPSEPTMTELAAGAQRLVFTLLRDSCGDAELYLSSFAHSGKRCTVTFDYVVGGTPLRFSDGSHAAEVVIDEQTVTAFSLRCRSYTLSDVSALLLPVRQAAAIAAAGYHDAELRVCYEDSGADTVGVNWFAD